MPVTITQVVGTTPAAEVADPHWANVSALLKFNNRPWCDLSQNNWPTTVSTGSSATDVTAFTTRKRFGFASIDQSTQISHPIISSANMNGNTAFSFGTGEFTIEAWCWVTTAATTTQAVCGVSAVAANSYQLQKTSGDLLRFLNNGTVILSSGSFPLGQWFHLAVNRTGSTLTMYVDGVSVASTTYSSAINAQTDGTYAFGFAGVGTATGANGANGWTNGQLDEIRITKGVGRYPSNFTPPNYEFQVTPTKNSLLHLNSSLADSGAFGFTWTGVNAAYDTTNKMFGTAAWNGSSSPLRYAQVSGTGKGVGSMINEDYTMEAWARPTSVANTPHVVQAGISSGIRDTIWISGGNWSFSAVGHGGTLTGPAASANTWYHVAVSKKNGVYRFFVNGQLVGTLSETAVATNTTLSNAGFMVIGTQYNVTSGTPNTPTAADTFNGQIDEVRFLVGKALYTESFPVPTEAFT